MAPATLTDLLEKSAKYQYRRGPIHGDLNAENIRVRNGEAILIDFYKSTVGPLVADLASLEVTICFAIEAQNDWDAQKSGTYAASSRFKEWRRQIDKLCIAGTYDVVHPLQDEPPPYSWMWSACRQLRLMAHAIDEGGDAYGYILAAYMLRMAMFPENDSEIVPNSPDAMVRAYAYWTAERMLSEIARPDQAA